jgi:hypothetical protein
MLTLEVTLTSGADFPASGSLYIVYFSYCACTIIFFHALFFYNNEYLRIRGSKFRKKVPKLIEYAYAALISVSLLQIFSFRRDAWRITWTCWPVTNGRCGTRYELARVLTSPMIVHASVMANSFLIGCSKNSLLGITSLKTYPFRSEMLAIICIDQRMKEMYRRPSCQ